MSAPHSERASDLMAEVSDTWKWLGETDSAAGEICAAVTKSQAPVLCYRKSQIASIEEKLKAIKAYANLEEKPRLEEFADEALDELVPMW